jgi:hypothetical protein
VGLRADLSKEATKRIPCLCRGSNLDHPVVQLPRALKKRSAGTKLRNKEKFRYGRPDLDNLALLETDLSVIVTDISGCNIQSTMFLFFKLHLLSYFQSLAL